MKNEIVKKCGQRISEIRKENKLSQSDFAKKIDISRTALSNYERGERTPDFAVLKKISLEFNVPFDYITGNSDVKTFDKDIKMICENTGLSEKALQNLSDIVKSKDTDTMCNDILNMINILLTHEFGESVLLTMYYYINEIAPFDAQSFEKTTNSLFSQKQLKRYVSALMVAETIDELKK